ncbi:MAG: radical SAM protein [Deltaproteobacteria bacterium]|nr:radical SAM protein [Deltaproteobacteria bacterium]
MSGEKSRRTFDPVKRAEDVAAVVCKGDLRKYYRFRPARFYGGIATSDCVGCCLQCIFCWSWNQVVRPEYFGQYYSPRDVAGRLLNIARKKRYRQMRISGNEPTIGRDHLIRVLELMPKDTLFILETNGILIGYDKTYAEDLEGFHNLYVRVSIKGCTNEQFSMLTGADSQGFDLQIQAVENLYRAGVRVHPAVMVSFSSPEDIHALQSRLGEIDKGFKDVEIEELVLYGEV